MGNQQPSNSMPNLFNQLSKTADTTESTTVGDAMLSGRGILPPRLFYEAVEQSHIAISITDLKANILYANPAFQRVTGYNSDEIQGENESFLSDKHTPQTMYDELWGCLQQQKTWAGVLLNRHKDGSRYLAEVSIAPMINEQGETVYYLGMHRNITEMHRLGQQVKNQKAVIESVVDSAPVVIALLDHHSEVVLNNQEYKKLGRDLQGREPVVVFLDVIKGALGAARWEELYATKVNFEDQEVRLDLGGRHQPRWFVCSGTWFEEHEDGADDFFQPRKRDYLLFVANEITELKRQQEEVRMNALRALLAESELVDRMRETLEGAIHELQVPINLITAAISVLERRAADAQDKALHEALQQASNSGHRALDKLRHCVPMEMNEAMVLLNLNELVRDALTVFTERLLSEGIVVDWHPALVLPAVLGQMKRLRNMFKQLVSNAIDSMGENRNKNRELRIFTHHTDDTVTVIIEDSGHGIPEHLRFRVFEPFFTTKRRGGTGMGLATVQEIMNSHAGSIRIDPQYTEGCRFIVQLPTANQRINR
jgi:nitrogen fixation negative regulator NifL